jgi:hypothetical protein
MIAAPFDVTGKLPTLDPEKPPGLPIVAAFPLRTRADPLHFVVPLFGATLLAIVPQVN